MYRTHNNGELRLSDVDKKIQLCGWVQKIRRLGGMTFVDLRDRYGVTQLNFNESLNKSLSEKASVLGREWVISIEGEVKERSSKNDQLPTGDIEIEVSSLDILNPAKTPPFTIEDDTDGGEELRMKFRYLDLRRNVLKNNISLRHKVGIETRKFLSNMDFLEIETPYLIKSTPEGARDFVVPSRMNPNEFYALPQSPQTFKQLLMVSGYDRYFQIVKCFRDEDLRADRQPEFTQIDCEMAFVSQEEVRFTFEALIRHLFKTILNVSFEKDFPVMTYDEAMNLYGSDKPDLRFDMKFHHIKKFTSGKGFRVFDEAESVIAIKAPGAANYSRKQLDQLTNWVKRPQIGAKGLAYVKFNEDGSIKSSIDKFYDQESLSIWKKETGCQSGDILFILSGTLSDTQKQMSELRLKLGRDLNLIKENDYKPVWIVDFPLFELDEETNTLHAMHHPFTSPKDEDMELLKSTPEKVKANAYDLAINGVEVGGGSIRIHNKELQEEIFNCLGFTKEEATNQFGFLLNAFEYGAPPHGGIAFGFDRLCALFGGQDSIRDFIAFPKNNSGRDPMLDAPSTLDKEQLDELALITK